jgi:Tol biopolymer transport system component
MKMAGMILGLEVLKYCFSATRISSKEDSSLTDSGLGFAFEAARLDFELDASVAAAAASSAAFAADTAAATLFSPSASSGLLSSSLTASMVSAGTYTDPLDNPSLCSHAIVGLWSTTDSSNDATLVLVAGIVNLLSALLSSE